MSDGTITIDIEANENVSDSLEEVKNKANALEGPLKQAAKHGGKFSDALKSIGKFVGFTALSASLIKFGKDCVKAYSDFEQMSGGVQQLFGKDAPKVLENANKAFKSAGLSANQYMEQATAFSAKLINDLGDTAKAAEYVDKAMIQMADNSNTFGTSIESLQNAYQGLAREQYTMLDNLKLGYGGTKQEMERLLSDAEKLTGQKFDIENFNDVIDAIQVIQDQFHVTGKTMQEAETTIEGSLKTMQASWENLKLAMASGEDIERVAREFGDSAAKFAENLAPVLLQIGKGVGDAAVQLLNDIDWGQVSIKVGEFALEGVEVLTSTLTKMISESLATGFETALRGLLGDETFEKLMGFDIHANNEKIHSQMEPFFQAMEDVGIDRSRGMGKVWADQLYEALGEGNMEAVQKTLDDINHAFNDNGENKHLILTADGELRLINQSELAYNAWMELQDALESNDQELIVEKAIQWKTQAESDGVAITEIEDNLRSELEAWGAEPEEIEKILDLIFTPGEKDAADAQREIEADVENTAEQLSGKHGLAKPKIDSETGAGKTTNKALPTIAGNVNKAAQEASRLRGQSNPKVDATTQGGTFKDLAKKAAQGFVDTVVGGINAIRGHATAFVDVSVKANILGSIKGIMAQVKAAAGGSTLPHGPLSGLKSLIGNGAEANGPESNDATSADVLAAGSGTNNIFYKAGLALVTAISKGVAAGESLLNRVFDRMLDNVGKSISISNDSLAHIYDGLIDKYKYLDENAEKWEKRLAEIAVEENKARLNTGKTALENEKLQIAYEQSVDALFKLSDEYKNYQKALDEAAEKEKAEQKRLEELKKRQEDLADVQEDLNDLYDKYVEKLNNSYSKGDLSLKDDYKSSRKKVQAMEQLPDVLDQLQAKGMPLEFIKELLNLDPEEALEVARKYLKMGDKTFNRQLDLWARGTAASKTLSVYSSGVNGDEQQMYAEMLEKLKSLPEELRDAILQAMKVDEFKRLGFDDNQVHLDFRLTWDTMTTNDLARLLAPMITAEQSRDV